MNDKTGGEKTVKKRLLLLLICMLFLLSGYTAEAAKNEEKTTYLFAMDTTMTIRVFGGDDALMQSLQKRVNEIENQVSVTREYSDIYRLNHEGNVAAGPDTETILNRALNICEETEGALDVSIYPVVREWGFTTGEYRVPSPEKLEELLASVDYKKVEPSEDGYHIPDSGGVIVSEALVIPDYAKGNDLYTMGNYQIYSGVRQIVLFKGSFDRAYPQADATEARNILRGILRHEFRHHLEFLGGIHNSSSLEAEDEREKQAYLSRHTKKD